MSCRSCDSNTAFVRLSASAASSLLRGIALVIGDCLLHFLLRGRASLQERFLAGTLGVRAHHVRLRGVYSCLGGDDLCLCLINTGDRALNLAVLKLALTVIVLNCSFRSLNRRGGLIHLCAEIVIIQLDYQISFVHLLVIRNLYVPHDARNFCAERSQIAAYIGIVCDLFSSPTLPGVPVPGNRGEDHNSQQNDQCGHYKFPPFGFRLCLSLLWFRRLWRSRRARCGHP